jgi:hypothetical protein
MCLGSIAHLQYYFARTGLLDGKGAQMARPKKGQKESEKEIPRLLLTQDAQFDGDLVESPADDFPREPDLDDDDEGELMLPPTVSTYSIKTHYIPPPPKLPALRKALVEALDEASLAVKATDRDAQAPPPAEQTLPTTLTPPSEPDERATDSPTRNPVGWHEIQGVHILDVVTMAIRAARIYYTSHDRPDRLAAIKSERQIREELFAVLDVLKGWASRDFAGGLRNTERAAILEWMAGVLLVLDEERRLELSESHERASWAWASGDWTGRERQREEEFLQTLMNGISPALPQWSSPDEGPLPTPLLERLRDGRDLIRIHNEAVRKSRRLFGEIKTPYEDIAKPYRRAENLRYWKKAAELRWEIRLEMDVMGVVYGSSDEAWKQFDTALLAWCKGVREEMARDWRSRRNGSVASLVDVALPVASAADDVSAAAV